MKIKAQKSEDFSLMMKQAAYTGKVKTSIKELKMLESKGKITNLKIKNLVQEKNSWFSFLKKDTHDYSTVVSYDIGCFKVHMMRPESNKEIYFFIPKTSEHQKEVENELTIII